MVVDKLENIMFYDSLVHNLKNGMEAIKNWKDMEVGKYQFEGGYFMLQKGQTKPLFEGTYEAHRNYVDVQIILEGCEEVGWASMDDVETAVEYNPEKDVERLSGEFKTHMLIPAGNFYMAFPHDAHKPGAHSGEQHEYTKIVMKLPVNE